MSAYVPRAGSIPLKVIEHLKEQEPGTTINTAEITERFAVKGGVSTMMKMAVGAGLVVAEKVGQLLTYSLPPEPGPDDGKLEIATYSDGDVLVKGGVEIEGGGMMYTSLQIRQLVDQVTTPHTRLAPKNVEHHPA